MAKHPRDVLGLTPEELSELIRRTSYDYQRDLYEKLAIGYHSDGDDDLHLRNRPQLADGLYGLSEPCHELSRRLEPIWKICEPRMEK